MKRSVKYRRNVEYLYKGILFMFVAITLFFFAWIVWELFSKGYKSLHIGFFTESLSLTESIDIASVGIANAVYGSFYVLFIALILSLPIGLLTGIYLYEKENSKYANAIRIACSCIAGLPSIIIGFVVYIWIVMPLHSFSALAGGIALAIVMYPVIAQSTFMGLKSTPTYCKEVALSLGCTNYRAYQKILIPLAFKDILSGILLAMSKAIGDTAALIFTALGASMINWNIFKPTATMPALIWNIFDHPHLQDFLWSASLILFIIIIIFNLIARKLSKQNRLYYG